MADSIEKMRELVTKVDEAVKGGATKKEALKANGLTPGRYYYYVKAVSGKPAKKKGTIPAERALIPVKRSKKEPQLVTIRYPESPINQPVEEQPTVLFIGKASDLHLALDKLERIKNGR